MHFLKFCGIFILITVNCESNQENEIAISIIQELKIKHCIIIDQYQKPFMYSLKNVKFFAKENIFSSFMDTVNFFYNLKGGKFPNFKTAAFIKTSEMVEVFNIYSYKLNIDFVLPSFTWIIFDDEPDIRSQLSQFYIPYNCQFFLIKNINDTHYEISEIYRTKYNSQFFEANAGFWSLNGGLSMSPEYFYQRRLDMYGTRLSWSHQFEILCAEKEECKHAEILLAMRNMLNFTVDFWWVLEPNNVSKKLDRKLEGDLRSIVINPEFFASDFIGPTFDFKGYFHIKNIGMKETGISAYAAPFSKFLWTYVYFYLLLSAFCIICIEYSKAENFELNKLLTFTFVPFDIIINQSIGSNLRGNLSTRIALLAIKATALIIVPAYTGAITSYLTVSAPKLPFTDLATFVKDGTYRTSGLIDTYSYKFFLRSFDPTVVSIKQRQLLGNPPSNLNEAFDLLCNTKFAIVAYNKEIFSNWNGPQTCKILQIPKPIFSTKSGFFLRSKSPYKKIFRKNLILFFSSGVMKKERIFDQEKVQNDGKQDDYVPIDLLHILPLLYLLISLKVISFSIFLAEIKFKPKMQKKLIIKKLPEH